MITNDTMGWQLFNELVGQITTVLAQLKGSPCLVTVQNKMHLLHKLQTDSVLVESLTIVQRNKLIQYIRT